MAETRSSDDLFDPVYSGGLASIDMDASAAAANHDLGPLAGGVPVILNIVDSTNGGAISSSDDLAGETDVSGYRAGDRVLAIPTIAKVGATVNHTQANGSPDTYTAIISPNVHLRRGNSGRLYNVLNEASHAPGTPTGTEWRNDTITAYTTFEASYNNAIGDNILLAGYGNAFMRDTVTGIEYPVAFNGWQSGGGGGFNFDLTDPSGQGPGWDLIKLSPNGRSVHELIAGSAPASTSPLGDFLEGDLWVGQYDDYALLQVRNAADGWDVTRISLAETVKQQQDVVSTYFDWANGDILVHESDGIFRPGRLAGAEFSQPTVGAGESDISLWLESAAPAPVLTTVASTLEKDPDDATMFDMEGAGAWAGVDLTATDPASFPEGLKPGLSYQFHTFVKKEAGPADVHGMRVVIGAPDDGNDINGLLIGSQNIWTIDPVTGVISQEHDTAQARATLIDGAHGGPGIAGRGNSGNAEDAGDYWKVNFVFLAGFQCSFYHYRSEYRNNGGSTTNTPSNGVIRVSPVHLPYKYEIGTKKPRRYLARWDAEGSNLAGAATNLLPIENQAIDADEGGIVVYAGSNSEFTFVAKDKPVLVSASIKTDGVSPVAGQIQLYWSTPANPAESVQSSAALATGRNGNFGGGVNQEPADLIIMPGITVTARLTHQASSNNQRVQAGSFILAAEM